jgi:divalent metal cation (Fe/Co/Zn/Cd) transporter
VSGLAGRDASAERVAQVQAALAELATNAGAVRDVHDVRVRETPEGEIVNFHCNVDSAMTVTDVHDKVDDIERALKLRFPALKRVIGHAEPR